MRAKKMAKLIRLDGKKINLNAAAGLPDEAALYIQNQGNSTVILSSGEFVDAGVMLDTVGKLLSISESDGATPVWALGSNTVLFVGEAS